MLILRAVNNVEEKFILCRFHFCLCLLSFPVPEENEKEFFSTCKFGQLGITVSCGVKLYRNLKHKSPCTDLVQII